MYDHHDNGLKPLDWAMILFGAWILYVTATALWIEPAMQDGIGLRNGVLQVHKAR